MLNTAPEVSVACAVIWRDGQILLSKRHAQSHQGGLWEFPGGKLESNESPESCLRRELQEELGIAVRDTLPICQIPWDYGDKRVRLWVFEVLSFTGQPEGKEGQRLMWVAPDALGSHDFPKANDPITRAVGLPRLARFFDQRMHQDAARWASQSDVSSLLYFRGMPPSRALEEAIQMALDIGHAVILTQDQLPCYQPGCGMHVRKSDALERALEALSELDQPWPVTAGIRTMADWERQRDWPADAWFVSPIHATPTHPELAGLGLSGFSDLIANIGAPAYALGGMTRDDLDRVHSAFGYGVAGIRGV